MTVEAVDRYVAYTGDGSSDTFAVPFQFFEITVKVDDVDTNSGYTISQILPGLTGSVVFDTPPAHGASIEIEGYTEVVNTVELDDESELPIAAVNSLFDRLTMAVQELSIPRTGAAASALAAANSASLAVDSAEDAAASAEVARLAGGLSVKNYGAVGDGIADDTSKITDALNAAVAAGIGTVLIPSGTYKITGTIIMKPYVRVVGEPGAVIKQGNGANLTTMIAFGSAAHSASIENVTIDGNRSNNSDNSSVVLVHIHTSSYGKIVNCAVVNSTGYGIATNGLYSTISGNRISNFYEHGIAVFNAAPSEAAFHVIEDNRLDTIGWSGIILANADYSTVRNNVIRGGTIGGRGGRVTVNTSGTTVTWASGPTFSGLKPGQFVVLNGGQEFRIVSVTDSTHLEIASSAGTLTGVEAILGPGDLLAIVGSSFSQVYGNEVYGNTTYGVGLSLGGSTGQCGNNMIRDNVVQYSGKNGINITYDSGSGYLTSNMIVGNLIFNPGDGGTSAIGATDRLGIYLGTGTAGKIEQTLVDGNSVESATGGDQVQNWLGQGTALSTGSVIVGANVAYGMANGMALYGTDAVYRWTADEPIQSPSVSWKGDTADPAIGNGTAVYKAERDGNFIYFSAELTMGSTTTFGTGSWYFQLPAPFNGNAACFASGAMRVLDAGTTYHAGSCWVASGTNKIYMTGHNQGNDNGPAFPMVWAANDRLQISIRYPIA